MTNKQSTLNLSVTDSTTKPHTLRTFLSDRETCCCAGSRIVRDFCLLPQPCYHRPIDLPLLFFFVLEPLRNYAIPFLDARAGNSGAIVP